MSVSQGQSQQQGGAQSAPAQPQQSQQSPKPVQQGSGTVFRDWASI